MYGTLESKLSLLPFINEFNFKKYQQICELLYFNKKMGYNELNDTVMMCKPSSM
jgi:hypothetical protein